MKIILIIILAIVLLFESSVSAQDSLRKIDMKMCGCPHYFSDSINVLITGTITNEFGDPYHYSEVYFLIDGNKIEGITDHNDVFEILVKDLRLISDSVLLQGKFVGFEQKEIILKDEGNNTFSVKLFKTDETYPVLGGVILFEERYNIRNTKVITIKSEEIRGMPRR